MPLQVQVERIDYGDGFAIVDGWVLAPIAFFSSAASDVSLATADASPQRVAFGFERADAAASATTVAKSMRAVLRGHWAIGDIDALQLRGQGWQLAASLDGAAHTAFAAQGLIEQFDDERLSGWVFDPAAVFGTAKLQLQLAGQARVDVTLTQPRPELSFLWPDQAPVYGFQIGWPDLLRALRGCDHEFALDAQWPLDVVLTSSGRELHRSLIQYAPDTRGRLERIDAGRARGWAVDATTPDRPVRLEFWVDGARYHEVLAQAPRGDLAARGISDNGGGFVVGLPLGASDMAASVPIAIRRLGVVAVLGQADLPTTALPRAARDSRLLLAQLPQRGADIAAGIAIVVPIFNARDDVEKCIEAVLRVTAVPACRLLLIDDASTDPAIGVLLDRYDGRPGVEVHRNGVNRGYTATVNRGCLLAGDADVVLLNSDTEVSTGWLESLRIAAYHHRRVATVTALSNNAGAFSVPEIGVDNRLPDGWSVDDVARAARQASLGLYPSVPTGNGFCLYIRRDALRCVGGFDEQAFPRGYGEENDFCMRAERAGYLNLVDDRSYVYHRRSASFGDQKQSLYESGRQVVEARYPEYQKRVGVFHNDPSFLSLRWRMRRELSRHRAAQTRPRPRLLFVISTQTGGTPQTNRDLMEALADRYDPWLLRCDSQVMELSRLVGGELRRVESHGLRQRLSISLHRADDYDDQLADWLVRHAIELVHVRHIAWHGLGLTQVCRLLQIPVVFSFHDFYTVCPTIKLLDAQGRHCAGRCTDAVADCSAELWPASSVPPLKGRFIHRWREMMQAMLADVDACVTTSPAAREQLLSIYPPLAQRPFKVIAHGRSFDRFDALAAAQRRGEPLRVLVPGNISLAKGAQLIADVAQRLPAGQLEFHLLGDPGIVPAGPNVVLHGKYQRGDFHDKVAAIGPHIGAVLSIWPETYCHTLTEMWACGLPVAAFDIGAVGERIAAHGGGWLLPLGLDADALAARLLALKAGIADRRRRIAEVIAWQAGEGRERSVSAMAADYEALYGEVTRRRRAWPDAQA